MLRDLEQKHALRRRDGVGAAPRRDADYRHAEHGEEDVENRLQPPVEPAEHEHRRHAHPERRPGEGGAEAQQRLAREAEPAHQERAVDVAEDHRHDGDEERHCRVHALEAREHALAVLVAELILGDDRHENEAHEQGERHRPHQRVAVVAAGDGGIDEVASAEPSQRDHQPGPERPDVLPEAHRHARPGLRVGHRYPRQTQVRHSTRQRGSPNAPVRPCEPVASVSPSPARAQTRRPALVGTRSPPP